MTGSLATDPRIPGDGTAVVTFVDRVGRSESLRAAVGERLEDVLLRHRIPPASVLAFDSQRQPVTDSMILMAGDRLEVVLIEGYDVNSIRSSLRELSEDARGGYVKRRLTLDRRGGLNTQTFRLDLPSVASHVEQTVAETCTAFDLVDSGRVLVGLSGGVDSGGLVLALAAIREQVPDLEITAVTFEDFDMATSPTLGQAKSVAEQAGVEHLLVPASRADEIFNLKIPLREALPLLMQTQHAHHAMYVDSHTTRRVLEVVAEERGIDRIALGLHVTDLVAGLLNGFMTGYPSGSLPARTIADMTFIYPLAFVPKRELHLYFLHRMQRLAQHTIPNQWEHNPLDRNFYYYLADTLQTYWPGMEIMLVAAQERAARNQGILVYGSCSNCGGAYLQMPLTAAATDQCDVCRIFKELDLIRS
jgi:tRNA(Ile)-lysidine synthase TilS/MesJ